MPLSAKTIRTQLSFFKNIIKIKNFSLDTVRRGQDKIGELMSAAYRKKVLVKEHRFEKFSGVWLIPRDTLRSGAIIYIHGGGYCCGSLDYAKAFGSALAVQCGSRVFCVAYRLAPEHKYALT